MAETTPIPWEVGQFEWLIVTDDNTEVAQVYTSNPNYKANASLICRAVNNHERLLSALKGLLQAIEADELLPESVSFMRDAREAVAQAEEK